ncbi:MAG: hypothetical protein V4584_07090 [Verrucomicrobiota bacterium]
MKTLFCLLAMMVSLARMDATTLDLEGDLTWEVTEPRCTFKLDGYLQNNTGFGSGTLKLVLWATQYQFPSAGYIVGEYTIGAIGAGSQFKDFTVKSTSHVPSVSGDFYFTIAISEYTPTGWKNVLAVPYDKESLLAGNFRDQLKWTLPKDPVTAPLAKLRAGDLLSLKLQATDLKNLFPPDSQIKTTLDVQSKTKINSKDSINKKRTASYKYSVIQTKYRNKKVSAGKLTLNYPEKGNTPKTSTVVTLYFQGPTSGTYKSVEKNSSGEETTWGIFTLQ